MLTRYRAEVALRKESVDRNTEGKTKKVTGSVALRKESVDRNSFFVLSAVIKSVALRKESVDRNTYNARKNTSFNPSLSARRAWIEIRRRLKLSSARKVALRKESVDRNGYLRMNEL